MGSIRIDDFSLGLNTRDSANTLKPGETPAASNWRLDERGALRWRDGMKAMVALPGTSGLRAWIYYSHAVNHYLCIRGTDIFKRSDLLSGSWVDIGNVHGGISPGFVDWPGNTPLVLISDGLGGLFNIWSWDGVAAGLTSLTGTYDGVRAVWNNRVWAIPRLVSPTFVWSARGDHSIWNATNLNVVREQDAAALVGAGVAGGALLLFKKRSAYRVLDGDTGGYQGIDSAAGAVSPYAIVPYRGHLFTWGADGIYEWDGVGPGKPRGDRFRPNILDVGRLDLPNAQPMVCGGVVDDRIVFAYVNDPAVPFVNDKLMEFDPETDAIVTHALPSAANDIGLFTRKGKTLYAGISDGDDFVEVFTDTPGADQSTVFTGSYRTPWFQPEGSRRAQLRLLRIQGLIDDAAVSTTLELRVYKDFDLSSYDAYPLEAALRGGDSGDDQEHYELAGLGLARSVAFELVAGGAAGDITIRSLQLDTFAVGR